MLILFGSSCEGNFATMADVRVRVSLTAGSRTEEVDLVELLNRFEDPEDGAPAGAHGEPPGPAELKARRLARSRMMTQKAALCR